MDLYRSSVGFSEYSLAFVIRVVVVHPLRRYGGHERGAVETDESHICVRAHVGKGETAYDSPR